MLAGCGRSGTALLRLFDFDFSFVGRRLVVTDCVTEIKSW
jgi:hypothetical protein